MLTSLYVENFAIVSRLELDFTTKMSAFTGETGAGKSIMIDALLLALGERADASVVRKGCEKCEIQACFEANTESPAQLWLQQHDITSTNNEIYLRRVIYKEGRSKSYINGSPFSLHKLKELSETLVDIHGQHQHQTLLKHATHRQQLDDFAGHKELLTKTLNQYSICTNIQQQIDGLQNNASDQEKTSLLAYQIEELEQLQVQNGEIEDLDNEHKLLHNAKYYLENLDNITTMLKSDSDNLGIISMLNTITQNLAELPQAEQITTASELITNAIIQCDETLHEINSFANKIQLDPERLATIEQRMAELHLMARKYHIDVHHLNDKKDELQACKKQLEHNQQRQEQLQQELQQAQIAYYTYAEELSSSRVKHAKKLSSEITKVIQQLGMPKGFVNIEITTLNNMRPHGMDKVEYKVCTNPGQQPDSLQKIISGGELSRISLAIQMITAQRGSTPTLFFDEIDVGIGGATAALVGKLLRNLSERLQVFCVTHQAQVAANAHQHFLVSKEIKAGQTYTKIIQLQEQQKIDELARMLGGLEVTAQTKLHAEEMLAAV